MLKKNSAGGFKTVGEGEDEERIWTPPRFSIGTPLAGSRGSPPENYMMTRVPFLKMTSFVPRTLNGYDPVILMGGPLDIHGNLMSGYDDLYGQGGQTVTSTETGELNSPISVDVAVDTNPFKRPNIPGVEDISIEYSGGGMKYGAHRTADISWKCWNWDQLQDYTPHFLQHGNTVLLEWGWSGIGELSSIQTIDIWKNETDSGIEFDVDKFDGNGKYNSLYDYLIEHINRQRGHYDAMLGIITDFEYSVNDSGGFDCDTTLVASGTLMLSTKSDWNVNDKFAELPALVKNLKLKQETVTSGYWFWKTETKQTTMQGQSIVDDKELAELAPYVKFKDYMENLTQECISNFIPTEAYGTSTTYDINVPGSSPQIMITTFIDDYKEWGFEKSIITNDKTKKMAGDKMLTAQELRKLHMTLSSAGPEAINEGGAAFIEEVSKSGGKKIDSLMVAKVGPKNKIKGLTKSNSTTYPQKILADSYYSPYEEWGTLTSTLANSENTAEEMKTPVGVYCTWGWFEDNVLSRFYGDVQTKGDGTGESKTNTEFRSVERLVNNRGDFVEWTDQRPYASTKVKKPVYVSTKMVNSRYLITTDTSKWIIPNPNDPIMSHLNFESDWKQREKANAGTSIDGFYKLNTGGMEKIKNPSDSAGDAPPPPSDATIASAQSQAHDFTLPNHPTIPQELIDWWMPLDDFLALVPWLDENTALMGRIWMSSYDTDDPDYPRGPDGEQILSALATKYQIHDWVKKTPEEYQGELEESESIFETIIFEEQDTDLSKTLGSSNLHEKGEWVKHYFDDTDFQTENAITLTMEQVAKVAKSNSYQMSIRNILFNTEFLKTHFSKASDILESTTKLWEDFSREYGYVYKFVLDFDEDGNRMKVREEGYTDVKIANLIESEKKKAKEEATDGLPALFTFPTWEDGSIVKSQTINAKLPDRMQQQAMYANSSIKYGDQSVLEKSYSSLAAKAWGTLSSEPPTTEQLESEEKKKQQRLTDLFSGKVDYPSRGNRSFGSETADIQNSLYVGPTPKFNDETGVYEEKNPVAPTGRGTKISNKIKDVLNTQANEYIQRRKTELVSSMKKQAAPEDKDGTLSEDDKKLMSFILASAFQRVSAVGDKFMESGWSTGVGGRAPNNVMVQEAEGSTDPEQGGTVFDNSNWSMFYSFSKNETLEWNEYDIHIQEDQWQRKRKLIFPTQAYEAGHVELKKELYGTLHALLRGNKDGVLEKQTPLLPIEMELEIDGTGGIFPGNSFHSSYLSDRYREQTVFQCMGASHKVDSSGWSTTLTGQIRYLPQEAFGVSPVKKIPPIQRDPEIVVTPEPEPEPEVKVDNTPPPEIFEAEGLTRVEKKPLKSTYKYLAWQNKVIFGYKIVAKQDGKDVWEETGEHHPEWQPKYKFSDGVVTNYKKKMVEQEDGTFEKKPYIEQTVHGVGKEVRKAFWDQFIEAPNESGESKGAPFGILMRLTL